MFSGGRAWIWSTHLRPRGRKLCIIKSIKIYLLSRVLTNVSEKPTASHSVFDCLEGWCLCLSLLKSWHWTCSLCRFITREVFGTAGFHANQTNKSRWILFTIYWWLLLMWGLFPFSLQYIPVIPKFSVFLYWLYSLNDILISGTVKLIFSQPVCSLHEHTCS